jgi:death-on-curing protein
MDTYYHLDAEDIRYLHDDQIELFGGIYGENEPGMIEYMAEKPFHELYGQELFPNIFVKAAVYLEGFATHQYFCDGNKRTGMKCCITFLLINGYELTSDDLEIFKLSLDVANNRLDVDEIAFWLEQNCIPCMDI